METKKGHAAALGRIPSGLFIVTAHHGADESGMLASWVQQCAFEPPLISVAVKSNRPLLAWLEVGAEFVVNILESGQTHLVVHFGKGLAPGQPAFDGLDIERRDGSAPILTEALAFLRCRVEQRWPAGDHELLVARVLDGALLTEGQPMVYVRKSGAHY